jgi:hypothetical protein
MESCSNFRYYETIEQMRMCEKHLKAYFGRTKLRVKTVVVSFKCFNMHFPSRFFISFNLYLSFYELNYGTINRWNKKIVICNTFVK